VTARRDPASSARSDLRRVQRASVRVALWVGLSSTAILGVITAVTVTAIVVGSRPPPGPRPGRPGRWDDRVVGVADILPFVLLSALVGVIALSLIAWYVSRRMTLPLAESLRVQRAFVADASHELRTPLTTLTTRIQLAQHRAERGGDVQPVLADLRRDADVLDGVLTDLLQAAEEAGRRDGDVRAVADVAAVAAAAAETLRPDAEAAGVRIRVDVPAGLSAAAEPAALTRACVALLDNAVRHSPPGAEVRVSARRAGRRVEVRVTDHGSGIQGLDPERVFDRFARADPTPPSEPGPGRTDGRRRGFGLGLALVRDIAVRFHGGISVEHTSPAGTTFLLVLPVPSRGVVRAG
jgi:two-component system, OmpR family, sensor kinase